MSNSLWFALEDEYSRECLIDIARQHVKLALEFSQRGTSFDRKENIKAAIEILRAKREKILYTSLTK